MRTKEKPRTPKGPDCSTNHPPSFLFFFSPVELAMIMDRLYGGVCYAGIDTDPELKYPKGAGRVAFSNQQSYIAAISARFVQLQHNDIDKRVSGFMRFIHISFLSTTAEVFTVIPMACCRAELCLSPLPCFRAFIIDGFSANCTAYNNGRPGPGCAITTAFCCRSPDRCFKLQTQRVGLIIVVSLYMHIHLG